MNGEANMYGVHIELVGDFNKELPSDIQYVRLNELIGWIQEKAVNAVQIK